MRHRQPGPTWPVVGILLCLFGLSLSAPRSWHHGHSTTRQKKVVVRISRHALSHPAVVVAVPTANSPPQPAAAPVASALTGGHPGPVRLPATSPADPASAATHVDWPLNIAWGLGQWQFNLADYLPQFRRTAQLGRRAAEADRAPQDALWLFAPPQGAASDLRTLGERFQLSSRSPSEHGLLADSYFLLEPQWLPVASPLATAWSSPASSLAAKPTTRWEDRLSPPTSLSQERPPAGRLEPTSADPPTSVPSDSAMSPRLASQREPSPSGSRWGEAAALVALAETLSINPEFAPWAAQLRQHVTRLTADSSSYAERQEAIISLDTLACDMQSQLAHRTSLPPRDPASRTWHALNRRLPVWKALIQHPHAAADTAPVAPEPERLLACLNDLTAQTAGAHGDGWRHFLQLEALQPLALEADRGASLAASQVRPLARQLLTRLDPTMLTPQQRQFLASPAVRSLREVLLPLAAEPVDLALLQRHLERYESTGSPALASAVAVQRQRLAWSDIEVDRRLAEELESHYRLSNLRIAVGAELLNRLSVTRRMMHAPVQETVLGASVRGQSTTTTDVRVRLVPDAHRIRMAVEAEGVVHSRTSSRTGPALLFNRSESRFQVRKLVEFTPRGVVAFAPQAQIDIDTQLRGVSSNLDGVPFLGGLTRDAIRRRYHDSRDESRAEMQRLVSSRVEAQVEAEAAGRIRQINLNYRNLVLVPLERLSLDPLACQFETTADRLVARLRVAGDDQLAAHTPRPRAPLGSQASVQIHESAVNNVAARLGLAGRTLSLAELHALVQEKLNQPAVPAPDTMPNDVRVTFAAQDPVRIECLDDRVKLSLKFREIRTASDRWRNFTVMVYYLPDLSVPGGQLIREGVVQLAGDGLRAKGQVALRGIFSKMFSKNRAFHVVPADWVADPRLADYVVTQFAIEDGWIGWALGKKTTSPAASATAKRPAATPSPPSHAPRQADHRARWIR